MSHTPSTQPSYLSSFFASLGSPFQSGTSPDKTDGLPDYSEKTEKVGKGFFSDSASFLTTACFVAGSSLIILLSVGVKNTLALVVISIYLGILGGLTGFTLDGKNPEMAKQFTKICLTPVTFAAKLFA